MNDAVHHADEVVGAFVLGDEREHRFVRIKQACKCRIGDFGRDAGFVELKISRPERLPLGAIGCAQVTNNHFRTSMLSSTAASASAASPSSSRTMKNAPDQLGRMVHLPSMRVSLSSATPS